MISFDIPTIKIKDNDVLKIYDTVREIREKMRNSECGPHFIECETYRWKEHVGPNEDYKLGYRSKEELNLWVESDQLEKLGVLLDKKTRKKLEQTVDREIEKAIDFAEESDLPHLSELYTDTFKD